MRTMNIRSLWSACLLGAINGALFAFVASPFRDAYDVWDYQRMLVTFNGIPPSMGRLLTPFGELLQCVAFFMLASILVHWLWSKRVKSTIVLWQLVALAAIIGPFVIGYLNNRLSRLVGAVQYRLEEGHWGELPGISQDLSFVVLLLAVAISLNFFYGAIIQMLVNRYPQRFKG